MGSRPGGTGCTSCRRRERAHDAYPQSCPACGEYALYSGDLDRWVHPHKPSVDCWIAMSSGQVSA